MKSQIYIPITECSTCQHLNNIETFWDKKGVRIEANKAANALEIIKENINPDYEKSEWRRCNECATYYEYELNHWMDAFGGNKDELMQRLTPTETIKYLSASRYVFLIDKMQKEIQSTYPQLQYFAAKSLTAYYFSRDELSEIVPFLTSEKEQIQKASIQYLFKKSLFKKNRRYLIQLKENIQSLTNHSNSTIEWCSKKILENL